MNLITNILSLVRNLNFEVTAKPIVQIMLTDKWLPCVPFLKFCCFIYAFWPIHTANLQAINALGRSDIFLKLEVIKKVIGIGILIITLPFGLYVMMIGSCLTTIISSIINAYPNKKLMNYSYLEQMNDIMPAFLLSIFMGGIVYSIEFAKFPMEITLIIQVIVGVALYLGVSHLFRIESYGYILTTLNGIISARKTSKYL